MNHTPARSPTPSDSTRQGTALAALVSSERAYRERGYRHKTPLDVGGQMALQVRRLLPWRDLVLVGDSAVSALLFLNALRRGAITADPCPRRDAALYDPAPPRLPITIGRPRKKGVRRPTLSKILTASGTIRQQVIVPGWYGMGERRIELTTLSADWHQPGLPGVPICWDLIRDPENRSKPQGLLCTDTA